MAEMTREEAIAELGDHFIYSTPDDYTTEELVEMVRRIRSTEERGF